MKIRKTVGIDLGTTNSVIALLDATDSSLITGQDDQGRMTFPSLVGYHPQRRLVAGREAQALKAAVRHARPAAVIRQAAHGPESDFTLGPETPHAAASVGAILRLLRDVHGPHPERRHYLLDSAVITMPAYFNHNQIEATRQAGELAGFEVVELLHEPTAAAIYYSWIENHGDATYLVYDLGGGTFDVSVIRRRLDDYEVLSVSGDPFLGGDDFDRLLASICSRLAPGASPRRPQDKPPHRRSLFDPTTPAGSPLRPPRPGRREHQDRPDRAASVSNATFPAWSRRRWRDADPRSGRRAETLRGLIKDKVDRTIDCCHEALAVPERRA